MYRVLLTVLTSIILTFVSIFAAHLKVAVANLGPHQSLLDVINGMESKAKALGLDIEFDIQHVNFDMTQIPKMLAAFKAKQPDVIVTLTTSVSQHAKTIFRDTSIPVVFAAITDPVEAKLLLSDNISCGNITGVSDRQDVGAILKFMGYHVPHLKRIGIPYAQNEANDRALLGSFQEAAKLQHMEIVPIPVDSLHDLPHRIRAVASSVDAIYVGPSNMIQPGLPIIIQQANRTRLPVFNFNEAAVKSHQALGSFAVSYVQLGHTVAMILKRLIHRESISSILPVYPKSNDHYGTVSLSVAKRLGISIPSKSYPSVTYVEE